MNIMLYKYVKQILKKKIITIIDETRFNRVLEGNNLFISSCLAGSFSHSNRA